MNVKALNEGTVGRDSKQGTMAIHKSEVVLILLFKNLFYLEELERGRERDIFHPLFYSPHGCKGQSCASLKLERGASSGSPMWMQVKL